MVGIMKFDHNLVPRRPDFQFEIGLWSEKFKFVAGLDEAGRGALAGPVAAAIVIFPPNPLLLDNLSGVNDSKLMRPVEREEWAARITSLCLSSSVGFASSVEIDEIGILAATRLAMIRAIESLDVFPQHLLIDFITLPDYPLPQTPLVKGDRRSLSIAAASILAKTARDDVMRNLDVMFPGYGFAVHKGYGTAAHRAALERLGQSPVHRRSFRFLKPISTVKN